MRIARCSIERSDLPVGRALTVTGVDDDDALRRALALNQCYWPARHDYRDTRWHLRPNLARTWIQPAAIVEFERPYMWSDRIVQRNGAYLHVLDDAHGLDTADLVALAGHLRPDAPAQKRV